MQESRTRKTLIHKPQLPQRSASALAMLPSMSLAEGGIEEVEKETPAYLQILQPVNQLQLEEAPGCADRILAGSGIEEDENIYDNDDCFPPEFIAKMKAKYKSKTSAHWDAQQRQQHSLHPDCYLSSSASSTDYENDSDSDLCAEVNQFQFSMRLQFTPAPQERRRRISALVEALDLPPTMRGRSIGLNKQQVRRAKQIIRLSRKKVPVAPKVDRGEEEMDGEVMAQSMAVQECDPEEDWQEIMSPPPVTDHLSQQQKLETFEKTLAAHGTPYTERTRDTLSAASRREQFTRSVSTPDKVPLPSLPASGRSKLQHYSQSAWDKSRTVLEPLPHKDKKSKKVEE